MNAPNDQPEYGQMNQPEYGAMASQYPTGYDPYVYGRPEEPSAPAQPTQPAFTAVNSPVQPPVQRKPDDQRRMFHGIDMNDPNQNPLYGHWDFYAILSLIFALLLPVPVLPAVMGGVAMWRTRTFRMKGFGLALAAVIINVLYTLGALWMAVNGLSTMDLYQQMMNSMLGGNNGGDGTSINV